MEVSNKAQLGIGGALSDVLAHGPGLLREGAGMVADWARENPGDALSLALSPIPVVGDAVGLANDLRHYVTDPESRNWLNYGLTALSALPLVPAAGTAAKGIRAYHGSPHDFPAERLVRMPDGSTQYIAGVPDALPDVPADATVIRDFPLGRFRDDKIGTGEGAQSFGHGHYTAEAERVGRSYRENLAGKPQPPAIQYGGVDAFSSYNTIPDDVKSGLLELHMRLSPYKDPSSKAILDRTHSDLIKTVKNFESGAIPMNTRDYENAKAALRVIKDPAFGVRGATNPGRMYEVNIKADPEHFLDWDKPLPMDHPLRERLAEHGMKASGSTWAPARNVGKDAFLAARNPEMTGQGVYYQLSKIFETSDDAWQSLGKTPNDVVNTKAAAAESMKNAGIPGIRYLDQSSRAAGEGTSNYVVFDPEIIEIIRKYGLLPAMLGGGAAAGLLGGMGEAEAEPRK